MPHRARIALAAALSLGTASGFAAAQESRSRWRIDGSLSGVRFTESEWHLSPGVSVSYRLTPRLEIGGDFSYLYACECDQDVVLVSRLSYDLATNEPVVPYVVGAGGILWHRGLVGYGPDGPPGLRPYWSNDPWISGGLGVQVRVTERFHLAPEAQVAYPLAVLFGLRFGFRF